jgi:hypothetical protein
MLYTSSAQIPDARSLGRLKIVGLLWRLTFVGRQNGTWVITLLAPTNLDRLLDFFFWGGGGGMCAFLLCRIYGPRFMKRRKSLPKWGGFSNGVLRYNTNTTLQLHAIFNCMEQSSLWRWRRTRFSETFPAKPFWTFFVVSLLKKKHRILKASFLPFFPPMPPHALHGLRGSPPSGCGCSVTDFEVGTPRGRGYVVPMTMVRWWVNLWCHGGP